MQKGDAVPEDDEDGRDIWFRFVSDDTVFYKGFNLSYIVKSRTRKFASFPEQWQVYTLLPLPCGKSLLTPRLWEPRDQL